MKNYWIQHRNKRQTIRLINGALLKFIGRKIHPIQDIYLDMQKAVIKYLKDNPDRIKMLTDDIKNFNYRFEIEDQRGFITEVTFAIL